MNESIEYGNSPPQTHDPGFIIYKNIGWQHQGRAYCDDPTIYHIGLFDMGKSIILASLEATQVFPPQELAHCHP